MSAFSAPYAPDDTAIAAPLLTEARLTPEQDARIDATATRLIAAIRARDDRFGGVEDMLREYALSTKEGLALMVLAEALLRVPDARTADAFIEDKLADGDFIHHETKSTAFLVNASAWALGLSQRAIQPGETPQGTLGRLAKRIGLPAVRAATRQAMRLMGSHFVLGETIGDALARAGKATERAPRYSYDMLGEGARTAEDAQRYYDSYAAAIDAIGQAAGNKPLPDRPGISVKLSALHPRYEAISRARVMTELVPRLIALAQQAKGYDLNFTVDAEEADRLELSLDVIDAAIAAPSLKGWDGFGLAIQAYQKRCMAVIDHAEALARRHDRQLMVRLVKGAYWDTEIKRAQERGLDGYPVFARKAMTDLNYIACARKLLALRPRIFPQFATHNALTVATILELADGGGYEFQRLHGMGDALYTQLGKDRPDIRWRTYAPVGSHRDLLAYLVRRLLENGANSSFVAIAADESVPVTTLLQRPAELIGGADRANRPHIPLPRDLYGVERANSSGIEFGERKALDRLLADVAASKQESWRIPYATTTQADKAIADAMAGFAAWSRTSADQRAAMLVRVADLLETRRASFIALLQSEGGKTLDDALGEVREAADFCRYYAAQGRKLFGAGETMPGPTGESNVLTLRGRGVFIAISPWNFPLAIFLGQIAAALMAGNSVVAKPAEQTPRVAAMAIALLHEAGVPTQALHLVQGDGRIGAALVAHPAVAGVVFTGSTEVARAINRTLAAPRQGWPGRTADRRDRRHQCDDRRCHRAARTGRRRCGDLRLPFRRPALFGAAAAVPAGGCGKSHDRDDCRCGARTEDRRSGRSVSACRPGHRCRGEAEARYPYRADERRSAPAPCRYRTARQLRRAACVRTRQPSTTDRGSVRPGAACGALSRRRSWPRAGRHRGHRLRPHPRHSFTHRRHDRAHHRASAGRQYLCEPEHDRRGGRRAALRRLRPVGHRTEGRRSALSRALRHRADREHQHRRSRRQCSIDDGEGLAAQRPVSGRCITLPRWFKCADEVFVE